MPARPAGKAAVALVSAALLALAAAPAHAADAPPPLDPTVWNGLAKTYQGTAKYQYEASALADGYVRTACTADPQLGGMGYHDVKASLFGSLDPAKPAALLYEDADANRDEWDFGDLGDVTDPADTAADEPRRLVAAEWIVVDKDGDPATTDDRPTLFGQKFDGPTTLPGLPLHYSLHAWLWKPNPSGMFAPWNPTVKCPTGEPTTTYAPAVAPASVTPAVVAAPTR
ncbi:hypothetical protein OK074_5623 [Actinobacteria bacterium OK074]|nr:hypothetical protein OK074_5623 [Actinobacteria bacterium OK074]